MLNEPQRVPRFYRAFPELHHNMNMAKQTWTNLWNNPLGSLENYSIGWVETLEDAEAVREAFQVSKSLTFVSDTKPANFGNTGKYKNIFMHVRVQNIIVIVQPF